MAAEQGVSQQAVYFKSEAEAQSLLASTWLGNAWKLACAVGAFAVFSLALHKIPWIQPANKYEALQLVTSKILIFSVLAYMLVLAVRNYTSHKHNEVVNRHRKNALKTFRAVVEVSGEKGTQDIILAYASACIFSPQETGFSQSKEGAPPGAKSILELMTKSGTGGGV